MAYIKELTEDKAVALASLGYSSMGKKVTKTKTFTRPKNVSKARWMKTHHLNLINKWEADLKIGKLSVKNIKFDEFARLWEKEHACVHLRESTLVSYKDQLDRIVLSTVGHLYLEDITPLHIQKMINDLAKKGLSRRTVKYPLQVLSSILNQAMIWGYIDDNPCRKVEIPSIPLSNKRKFYEADELKTLMEAVKNEPLKYQAIFYLALSGGLRRGEILDLRLCDVESGGVRVRKGKNDSSVRFVSLDKSTMVILRHHIADRTVQVDDAGNSHAWLFIQGDGSQMYKSSPTDWLRKLCNRIDVPPLGLHALRHTSATILISSGVDIRTVSGRIGHNNASTTIDIYAHMLKDKEEAAGNLIGDYLHPPEKSSILVAFPEKEQKKEA